MEPLCGPLSLGGHRVSSDLIVMETLDHSPSKAVLLTCFLPWWGAVATDAGMSVIAKEEKSRATHYPGD